MRRRAGGQSEEIERRALLDDIELDDAWRLLIVHGPTGYGKSCLLRQMLRDVTQHVHLAPGDDSSGVCVLQRVRDTVAEAPPGILISVDIGDREHGSLLLQASKMLANDDQNRLVFVTRHRPDPALVPLVREGAVKLVGPEELRFDLSETRQILAPFGLDADEEYMLHVRAGGWPLGLSMICRALGRGRRGRVQVWRDRGVPEEVDEFLSNEIWAKLGAESRHLLLVAGLSEIISAPSLSAGLQELVEDDRLDRLAADAVLAERVHDRRGTYRLQPLLCRWLRNRATESLDPDRLNEIHLRLAAHFSSEGDPRLAIEHLIEAGEYERAAQTFELTADAMVRDERLGEIVDFVERIPQSFLASRFPVISAATIAYSMRRQSVQAEAMVALCRQEIGAHPEYPGGGARLAALTFFVSATQDKCDEATSAARRCLELAGAQRPFDTGMSLNVEGRWLCSVQQYEEAEDVLLRAEARHDADNSIFGGSYQKGFLSTVFVEQGRVDEADLLLTRALRRAESREAQSIVGSVISAYLAQALYEKNSLQKAETLLVDYMPLIQQQGFIDTVALAHVILARTKAAQGYSGAAADVLGQGLAMGHKHDLPRLTSCMRAELIRLAVLDGDLDSAERRIVLEGSVATRKQGEELVFHPAEAEGLSLCLARLRIYQGRGSEVMGLLAHEKRLALAARRKRRLARIQALTAMHLADAGEHNASGRAMLEALRIAQQCNLSRTLLDEGPKVVTTMLDLFESVRMTADDPEIARLEMLLRSAGAIAHTSAGNLDASLTRLTQRESEILRFVALGLSNAELSRRISVSENTVKYHLKNLFQKCGISRRVQAVAVAKRFDLIA